MVSVSTGNLYRSFTHVHYTLMSEKHVSETVDSTSHTGWYDAGTVWIKKLWMHLV